MTTLNYRFLSFMKQKQNNVINDRFKKENYPKLNANIKTNFYSLDDIGIPIRFSEQNHKTVFGWQRIKINDEDRFYHHLVNVNLINIVDNETLKQQTIELIKTKYPNSFTSNGKMKKLLEKVI